MGFRFPFVIVSGAGFPALIGSILLSLWCCLMRMFCRSVKEREPPPQPLRPPPDSLPVSVIPTPIPEPSGDELSNLKEKTNGLFQTGASKSPGENDPAPPYHASLGTPSLDVDDSSWIKPPPYPPTDQSLIVPSPGLSNQGAYPPKCINKEEDTSSAFASPHPMEQRSYSKLIETSYM